VAPSGPWKHIIVKRPIQTIASTIPTFIPSTCPIANLTTSTMPGTKRSASPSADARVAKASKFDEKGTATSKKVKVNWFF